MKKSFLAVTAGVLVGATLLMGAAPAMAHDRFAIGVAIGAPVAVVPAPYYAPAPVVYGGPVVTVGGPYYRGWGYHHGYYGGYRGGYRGGYHGWHR